MASRPRPGCTRRRCRRSATRCGCGCGSCPISTARSFARTRRISQCSSRPSWPSRTTLPLSPTPTRLCSAPRCLPRRSCAKERARSRSISRRASKAGAISGPGASTRPVGARPSRRRWTGCPCSRRPERSSPRPTAATIIRACTTSPRGLCAFFPAPVRALQAPLSLKTTASPSPAPSTRVTIALSWTRSRVRVAVGASGNYPLPYSEMRVILPEDETRTAELSGTEGIELRL